MLPVTAALLKAVPVCGGRREAWHAFFSPSKRPIATLELDGEQVCRWRMAVVRSASLVVPRRRMGKTATFIHARTRTPAERASSHGSVGTVSLRLRHVNNNNNNARRRTGRGVSSPSRPDSGPTGRRPRAASIHPGLVATLPSSAARSWSWDPTSGGARRGRGAPGTS